MLMTLCCMRLNPQPAQSLICAAVMDAIEMYRGKPFRERWHEGPGLILNVPVLCQILAINDCDAIRSRERSAADDKVSFHRDIGPEDELQGRVEFGRRCPLPQWLIVPRTAVKLFQQTPFKQLINHRSSSSCLRR
jgi:hypothetical protein